MGLLPDDTQDKRPTSASNGQIQNRKHRCLYHGKDTKSGSIQNAYCHASGSVRLYIDTALPLAKCYHQGGNILMFSRYTFHHSHHLTLIC